MKRSVRETTARHRLCVGCGICELVCPEDAVRVGFSKKGEPEPRVDPARCTDCGLCAEYCPHSRELLREAALKTAAATDPLQCGLEQADCFLAFDRGPGRVRSASGGVVTRWLGDMLDRERLDGVIHGEGVTAGAGEPHFRAVYSTTRAQMDMRRGSFYAPLIFSPLVREHARGKKKRLVLVGTPCVVRGYQRLFAEHPEYRGNRLFTVALVCSHNVNHKFADFLYRSLELPGNEPYWISFRDKENIPHAGRYRIRVTDAAGKVLAHPDRMECAFTRAWRSYAFALNACHYCSDFWGGDADLSVKDAWGDWAQDPAGTSLIAVRNRQWRSEFAKAPAGLYLEALKQTDFVNSQKKTAEYRQLQVGDRWTRSAIHPRNLRSEFARHLMVAGFARRAWPRRSAKAVYHGIRLLGSGYDALYRLVARSRALAKFLLRMLKAPFVVMKWPFRCARFRRGKESGDILIVGGYGYGNLGDEAQLHTTWRKLEKIFPDRNIRVLTPDPEATRSLHGCVVGEAPRLAFFDTDTSPLYQLVNRKRRVVFLLRVASIYFNALMMRAGLPPFMLKTRRASLLEAVRTAGMVFFCGGGYLTGATRSRLWDGALLGRLAHLFNVPLVLSGQTMGLWDGSLSRWIAGWGFSHARLISLRDPVDSPADLKKAGISGAHVVLTHDDALFSEKVSHPGAIAGILRRAGMKNPDGETGYRVFQFHYWGRRDPEGRMEALGQAESVVRSMTADGFSVVLVSMTPADDFALGDLHRRCLDLELPMVRGEKDFRVVRGVIGNARLCVAMKHHPLVFALGEGVPVISLARSAYYVHKNAGALTLFGMEAFSLDLDSPYWFQEFERLLGRAERERTDLCSRIRSEGARLKRLGEDFFRNIDELLAGKGDSAR